LLRPRAKSQHRNEPGNKQSHCKYQNWAHDANPHAVYASNRALQASSFVRCRQDPRTLLTPSSFNASHDSHSRHNTSIRICIVYVAKRDRLQRRHETPYVAMWRGHHTRDWSPPHAACWIAKYIPIPSCILRSANTLYILPRWTLILCRRHQETPSLADHPLTSN
jgi:hypothetical protein